MNERCRFRADSFRRRCRRSSWSETTPRCESSTNSASSLSDLRHSESSVYDTRSRGRSRHDTSYPTVLHRPLDLYEGVRVDERSGGPLYTESPD